MSEETYNLLIAEFDADLIVRENLYPNSGLDPP